MRSLLHVFFVFAVMSTSSVAGASWSERIFSYRVFEDAVEFQVPSNGCTWRGSFSFETRLRGGVFAVEMFREIPDQCRAFLRGGIPLRFSRADLGAPEGAPIVIINAFAAAEGPETAWK